MKKKTALHTPKKKAHHAASIPKPSKPVEKKIEKPIPQPAPEPQIPDPTVSEPAPEPQQSPTQQMHHRIVKS